MKNKHILIPVLAVAIIAACKTQQVATSENNAEQSKYANMSPYGRTDYHATANRHIDIIHTALNVTPDWGKRYLYGKAVIVAKPYFYPTDVAQLDARGMDIKSIRISDAAKKDTVKAEYKYEDDVITVKLGRTYSRSEQFTLVLDYTAKPNELKAGGSAAISNDKGLYFIDPDDTDPTIPRQFWTQGETQASSAWFPTIDRPNERMTTEITMNVEPNLVTLSNGILVSSTVSADGLKADHWKMELPHAPYLVMMAAGDFKVVKDTWRGKEVSYYVEPEFEKNARDVFGNTPEMMEFFSNKLGVEYPWAKYSQICAREYVSGAMENTTATLHSDFLQMDKRELLDENYEEYISHELFHQWFGDYVTSESWSNLPLNESFATYGEYLWIEYKYGKEKADQHHYQSLQGYLGEAGVPYDNPEWPGKQEPLIRFNYEAQEDMFDSHSYNKGGQVLHMLRQEVGDDAFFASLKLYLETNKFQAVEIHNLRLAFEQTTGRDLNWFFNQWFMSPGHPELDITYSWDEAKKREVVIMKQVQDFKRGTPVYRLPLDVDVYVGGKVQREHIVFDTKADTFYFDAPSKPDLVNVDAQKTLLGWKKDHHTPEEWAFMYRRAPLFVDRVEAINALAPESAETKLAKQVITEATRDRSASLRVTALWKTMFIADSISDGLKKIVLEDSSSRVRATALYMLALAKDSVAALEVARKVIYDSSYTVFGTALEVITLYSHEEGMKLCAKYENATHRQMKLAVAYVYSPHGTDEQQSWFEKNSFTLYGRSQMSFLYNYTQFLERCKASTVEKAIEGLERLHRQSFSASTKGFIVYYTLRSLQSHYTEVATETEEKINQLGGPKKSNPRIDRLKEENAEALRMATLIEGKREALK